MYKVKRIGSLIYRDLRILEPKFYVISAIYFVITQTLFGTICFWDFVTGIPCAGCGITRASILLLTGHFKLAWEMHPFVYPLFALVITFFIIRYIKEYKLPLWFVVLIIIFFVLLILFYVWRMINVFPNAEPMVYNERNIIKLLYK